MTDTLDLPDASCCSAEPSIGQEPDSTKATPVVWRAEGRATDPAPSCCGSLRPDRVERPPVFAHDRAVRMRVGYDEEAAHRRRIPAFLPGENVGQDANLALERTDGCLDIPDPGLDFDDEQRASRRVPGNDICRPTLAEVVEGDLDTRNPAKFVEPADYVFDQRRVTAIDQSVKLAGSPPGVDRYRDVQGRADRAQSVEGDMLELSEFHTGDQGLAHGSCRCQIVLPPTATDPNLAHHPADSSVIHPRRMNRGTYRAIT